MKSFLRIGWVVGFAFVLAACGGSTGTTTAEEDGRLISGTLDAEASAMIVKAAGESGSCIGEVCAFVAYDAEGGETEGELEPALNRFQVRVRTGNWMFGFEDGAGNRLGYLAMNGITALALEDGEDIDVGRARLRGGQAALEEDVEDLGGNGIYSYYGEDNDRDGVPAAFDEDEPPFDADAFDVLFLRPHDGQLHVAPCRPIKIVFTKAIDDATVTADTVKVALEDGTPVAGTLSIWEDAEYSEYEVGFAPAGGYPKGERISVTVASGAAGVLSEAGDQLGADIETSFEVRDWGGTSQTCHDPDQERQQIRTQERERAREGDGSG
nr:Ig-like domain-containing protein [bacterium]